MLGFFERLVTKSRLASEKKTMTWRQLVIDICDGNEPPEDEVIEALQRLGKTIEDLRESVALLAKRREWSEIARKGAEARLKLNSIESEKAPHLAEFQAAEAKFNLAINEINERSSQLRLVAGQGDQARIELSKSATDPAIQQVIDRCGPRVSELNQRLERIGEELRKREGDLERLESRHGKTDEFGQKRDNSSPIAIVNSELANFRQQKKDISAEMAELQAEQSQASAMRLIPESIA
ncbi:hypothetical protein [Schlesneria sp. T3-172]|uniref:hypothetical protein n=1 Tax=Schlesneria sphaerica TaxID=3373610 RepID=UPI0037C520A9